MADGERADRTASRHSGAYVALCGGIGGAKLALGLSQVLDGSNLTIVVNTGDDFEHLGLHISPDVDTVMYTLAGIADPATGWGRRDETWTFMDAIERLGGATWFKLGDGDLAMHVERTRRMRAGEPLSAVCEHMRRSLGIAARVLPMSDDPVRTIVETDEGTLGFQEYFVGRQCEPTLHAIRYDGAKTAKPAGRVLEALSRPELRGVIICPSNPYLSIDPMLAVPGLRDAIGTCGCPVVAVSPIVGGRAIKGPAAKIMKELGVQASAATIVRHYDGLIDGLVLDDQDQALAGELSLPALVTNTVMRSLEDRVALARAVIDFCERLTDRSTSTRDGAREGAA